MGTFEARRDMMLDVLEGAGFQCFRPGGAYYIMTSVSGFGYPDDVEFVRFLAEDIGVAGVPGSSFFEDPRNGSQLVRFCFCKKYETLEEVRVRLARLSRKI